MLNESDHGEIWANIQALYAQALSYLDERNLRKNVEEARTAGMRAIRYFEQRGPSESLVSTRGVMTDTEYTFALRYLERGGPDRVEDIEAAISHLEIALRGYSKQQHPDYWADTQEELGKCYAERLRGSREDNLDKAIRRYREALTARTPTSNPRAWAQSMIGLAMAYQHRGARDHADIELSLATFREALDKVRDPELAVTINHGLGLVYSQRVQGDRAANIEAAIQHLTAALEGMGHERNPENWALTQQALGAAYDDRVVGERTDNIDKAIGHFEAALGVLGRERNPDVWAMTKRSLGLVYLRKHDATRAIEHLEDSLTVRTRERYPREWALTTDTVAGAYFSRNGDDAVADTDRAIVLLHATAEMHDRFADRRNWLTNRLILSAALQRQATLAGTDMRAEQVELLQDVLEHISAESDPRQCILVATRLGELLADLGRWEAAAIVFQKALTAAEVMYLSSLTTATRRHNVETNGAIFRSAAYALAKVGRLEAAVTVLEHGRARTLGEALDRDQADMDRLRREDPTLVQNYFDAVDRLRRIQAEEFEASGSRLVELATRARTVRDDLDRLIDDARRTLGEDFLAAPDLATIESAVEAGTAVAYLSTTWWGTLTLLLVRTEPEIVEIRPLWADDFTGRDIDVIMNQTTSDDPARMIFNGYLMRMFGWYETRFEDGSVALTTVPWDSPGAVTRSAKEEGGNTAILGERVMAGIGRAVVATGAERVVLIPCGRLGVLPVHTASYGGRCLLDETDVTFTPSARVLVRARERLRRNDWPEPVLAGVGNPLPHPNPLAFAAAELEQIARLFANGSRLYGEQATKEAVLGLADTATHVHLACHGSYELGDFAPHLQFAHAAKLSFADITRQRPFAGSRLVVMSACQSAILDLRTSDEVIGLTSAILAAGTPGVIATLWPVDDLSTVLLMDRFYTLHLRGESRTGEGPMTPGRALCRAQRWLATVTAPELHELFLNDENLRVAAKAIDDGSTSRYPGAMAAMNAARFGLQEPNVRPFENSYYWAPFVFVGE
ncbi:CHAT domain-containing protein [Streptomyces sp. SID3343]|nr:CHAT domain-containing protein [Streptomyces sp. SID3343]